MKMRMILPAGNSGASSNNGGGAQNNGGGQMNQNMNMPHAGPSPHAMLHHDPSNGGYQNSMGAMNAGMNAGMNGNMNMNANGYGARGVNAGGNTSMEMGMASVYPLKMPIGAMHPQARAMGFATNPEDYDGYGMLDSLEPEARRRRSRRTGRFIRGAADEGYDMEMRGDSRMRGLEMHGGGWGDDDEEDMGYAHSKPSGSDKALKKKIKMLEKKVEALQEALEEQEEGGMGKKGKKSKKHKPHGDEDDDDEEDEGESGPDLSRMLAEAVTGKEFLKQLPAILTAVVEVIKNPPQTWPPYLAKHDLSGIFVMEAKELMKAIEQYKAGQKPAQDVCKEMKHAGAALVQMYASLLESLNTEQSKSE